MVAVRDERDRKDEAPARIGGRIHRDGADDDPEARSGRGAPLQLERGRADDGRQGRVESGQRSGESRGHREGRLAGDLEQVPGEVRKADPEDDPIRRPGRESGTWNERDGAPGHRERADDRLRLALARHDEPVRRRERCPRDLLREENQDETVRVDARGARRRDDLGHSRGDGVAHEKPPRRGRPLLKVFHSDDDSEGTVRRRRRDRRLEGDVTPTVGRGGLPLERGRVERHAVDGDRRALRRPGFSGDGDRGRRRGREPREIDRSVESESRPRRDGSGVDVDVDRHGRREAHGVRRDDRHTNGARSVSKRETGRLEGAGDGVDGRRDRVCRAGNDDGLEVRLGAEVDEAGHVRDGRGVSAPAKAGARRRPDDREPGGLRVALEDHARLTGSARCVDGPRDEDVRALGERDGRLGEGGPGARGRTDLRPADPEVDRRVGDRAAHRGARRSDDRARRGRRDRDDRTVARESRDPVGNRRRRTRRAFADELEGVLADDGKGDVARRERAVRDGRDELLRGTASRLRDAHEDPARGAASAHDRDLRLRRRRAVERPDVGETAAAPADDEAAARPGLVARAVEGDDGEDPSALIRDRDLRRFGGRGNNRAVQEDARGRRVAGPVGDRHGDRHRTGERRPLFERLTADREGDGRCGGVGDDGDVRFAGPSLGVHGGNGDRVRSVGERDVEKAEGAGGVDGRREGARVDESVRRGGGAADDRADDVGLPPIGPRPLCRRDEDELRAVGADEHLNGRRGGSAEGVDRHRDDVVRRVGLERKRREAPRRAVDSGRAAVDPDRRLACGMRRRDGAGDVDRRAGERRSVDGRRDGDARAAGGVDRERRGLGRRRPGRVDDSRRESVGTGRRDRSPRDVRRSVESGRQRRSAGPAERFVRPDVGRDLREEGFPGAERHAPEEDLDDGTGRLYLEGPGEGGAVPGAVDELDDDGVIALSPRVGSQRERRGVGARSRGDALAANRDRDHVRRGGPAEGRDRFLEKGVLGGDGCEKRRRRRVDGEEGVRRGLVSRAVGRPRDEEVIPLGGDRRPLGVRLAVERQSRGGRRGGSVAHERAGREGTIDEGGRRPLRRRRARPRAREGGPVGGHRDLGRRRVEPHRGEDSRDASESIRRDREEGRAPLGALRNRERAREGSGLVDARGERRRRTGRQSQREADRGPLRGSRRPRMGVEVTARDRERCSCREAGPGRGRRKGDDRGKRVEDDREVAERLVPRSVASDETKQIRPFDERDRRGEHPSLLEDDLRAEQGEGRRPAHGPRDDDRRGGDDGARRRRRDDERGPFGVDREVPRLRELGRGHTGVRDGDGERVLPVR